MGLLRNPEVYRALLLQLVLTAAALIITWFLAPQMLLFTLLLCAMFIAVHLITTILRYRRIAELSAELDRILHDESADIIHACAEGELAILQSELHKMTVRLREQQQQMQADKVFLADSLADVSHQLRTPLTAINLIVTRLSKSDLPPETRAKLLRDLKMLLSRVDWLITALLKISKLDAGTVQFHAETLELSDLLRRSAEPVLIPLELRGIRLDMRAEGKCTCDAAWSCEALGNILKNCMEHTPPDGCITVAAEENPLYVQIRISDTGTGISDEDLPHIFERFYKGQHSDDSSYGIGLALARMIITSQNGTIKAENAKDGGAVFTIRFYKCTV